MANNDNNEDKKFIELWEGEKIEVSHLDLLKDYDFIREVQAQLKDNDLGFVDTLFVLIGGKETFDKVREHIIAETGVFDIDKLGKITNQLLELFPKASSSSSKRW